MLTPLEVIHNGLLNSQVIPYLGPGVLALADAGGTACPLPQTAESLVAKLTVNVSIPHKLRTNLTAAAQFMENFKHRKTVTTGMTAAFRASVPPTDLHKYLASLTNIPLIVHAWYDDLPQKALALRSDCGYIQGVSQAEHFGQWCHYFNHDGSRAAAATPDTTPAHSWRTVLYEPLGSISPAANFLVSDSDFVEVLTEIDIQTPIPKRVQELRTGRHFLFLGCRFATQLERIFARQIMKRSSDRHWAVLPQEPTRNELRFLAEQNIERIDLSLPQFAALLAGLPPSSSAETCAPALSAS